MAQLKIRTYPDAVLRKKAKRIKKIDRDVEKLIKDMIETLDQADGVGLAAPQVGESIQLCIIKPTKKDPALVLINPKICSLKGKKEVMEEGCLSVPDTTFPIKRPDKITVSCMNKEHKEIKFDAKALISRIIQHEMDHLNGVLILDRISLLKQFKNKRRLRKKASKSKTL